MNGNVEQEIFQSNTKVLLSTRIRIFDPPNIFRGDLKGLQSKDFILSRCAVYFFSLGTEELIYNRFKKPKKWPPIWTFAIRLRLFIFRGEGPILLHIIEIYFIVHRTALRFSHSDTRNLTFHLIDVWMSLPVRLLVQGSRLGLNPLGEEGGVADIFYDTLCVVL